MIQRPVICLINTPLTPLILHYAFEPNQWHTRGGGACRPVNPSLAKCGPLDFQMLVMTNARAKKPI